MKLPQTTEQNGVEGRDIKEELLVEKKESYDRVEI